MPIQHTVVFRLVHDGGSAAEADFLDSAVTELSRIPGVADFVVNRQVGAKSDLEWQFSMMFTDQQAYDAYTAHPAHVAFVRDRWQSEVAEFHELDFVPR